MSLFADYQMEWQGQKYTLPSSKMLRTIASVEDVLTLSELMGGMQPGRQRFAKLAMAYGIVLRAAGANVTDDEVYSGIFVGGASAMDQAAAAVDGLVSLMIPPEALAKAEKEPPKGNSAKADRRSSKKRSS